MSMFGGSAWRLLPCLMMYRTVSVLFLLFVWRPCMAINVSVAKAALVRNYLEVYWPCAGGLSAVNAIGTQLRDPINSGLTRWRMAVS